MQDSMSAEDAAKIVATYLVEEEKRQFVQFTEQSGGFKIWSSNMKPPDHIHALLLACTSSMSSTFKGSNTKVRTRFLDLKLLDDSDIEKLKALCDTFEDWTIMAYKKLSDKKNELGNRFFQTVQQKPR